jgi:D-inositol-3-phosphate glycosyltransferase
MNILFISHYFQPHIGGIEVVVYNEAFELVQAGHNCTVITSKLGSEKSLEYVQGIKVIRVKAWNILEKLLDVPFPIFSTRLFPSVMREVKNNDIIHIHGALYLGSFLSAIFGRIHKKTVVITEHVGLVKYSSNVLNLVEKIAFETIGRVSLSLSNYCIVLNDSVFDYISHLSRRPKRILNNGVDVSLFFPISEEEKSKVRGELNLPTDKPLVLFVGRFVQKKGLHILLDSKDDSFNLVCVGSGVFPQTNKRGVFVYYNLPQKILAKFYQVCDLFVLPSRGEGFSLSIQEAMASGLPVITTRENIPFSTKSPVAFSTDLGKTEIFKAIKTLLSAKILRDRLVADARDIVLEEFSWKAHSEKLYSIYMDGFQGRF